MWFPANYNTFSVYEDDPTRPYKLYKLRDVVDVKTGVPTKTEKVYISQHYTLFEAMDAGVRETKESVYIDTPEWTTWKHIPPIGSWPKGWTKL